MVALSGTVRRSLRRRRPPSVTLAKCRRRPRRPRRTLRPSNRRSCLVFRSWFCHRLARSTQGHPLSEAGKRRARHRVASLALLRERERRAPRSLVDASRGRAGAELSLVARLALASASAAHVRYGQFQGRSLPRCTSDSMATSVAKDERAGIVFLTAPRARYNRLTCGYS